MKKVIKLFGIIVFTTVIVFPMIADDGKKLVISGIELSGNVTVMLDSVAWGSLSNVTSGSNVTFDLKNIDYNISNRYTDIDWGTGGNLQIAIYNMDLPTLLDMRGGEPIAESNGAINFSGKTTVVNWSQLVHSVVTYISAQGAIAGSTIALNNLSRRDFDAIMQGSIFDVFTASRVYDTDLKKLIFLETDEAKNYQRILDYLRDRLRWQGIKTIQRQTRQFTTETVSSISNYDVNRGGFIVTLESGQRINRHPTTGQQIQPALSINGFIIPNINISIVRQAGVNVEIAANIFMPVPVNVATRIEGNRQVSVQLELDADTFNLRSISLINEDTNEVYATQSITAIQQQKQQQQGRQDSWLNRVYQQ
jgi:hypothetical protein